MEELLRITERLKALTGGNPAAPLLQGPKAAPLPKQGPGLPVRATNNAVLRRAQGPVPRPNIPGVGSTKTVLNAPGKGKGLTMNPLSPANLLREGAISGGLYGAGKLAESAGTQGQARMSGLGLMGPAPVYQTPLNNVTAEQVAADKAKRAGMTDLEKVIGKPPAKEEPLPSTYNVMGVDYDSASGQAINPATKKISPGGYSITPDSGVRTDYADGDSRLGSLGTDTGSGDREATRVAQTDNMSDNMKIWAAAHGDLAKDMVDRVDARRNRGLEGKQSGYETVRDVVYPERAVLAAEGNQGDFSVRDAVGGGMSPEEAGAIASGGFVETVFDKGVQGESKITNNSAEKATDLLSSYKKGLIGKAAGESEASEVQNPIIPGGDGTPDGAVSELQKKTAYEAPASMIGLSLDQVNSKMKQLGGDEYLKQLDAGRFRR